MKEIIERQKEKFSKFLRNFQGNTERLEKYIELMLLGKEASPYSYIGMDKIRCVTVVPTTKCGLKCVWCHRNEERIKDYLHKEMPIGDMKSLLAKLKGFNRLYFGGLGEPLLYPHIYEAIKEARKYIPDVRTTTNATMLTKEASDKLIEAGLTYLEVSIDGFDSVTNKKVRGVEEDTLIDGLKYLSDNSNIPIQINSVVGDVNFDSLYHAIDKLKDVKNIVCMHSIPLFMTKHMESLGIKEICSDDHRKLLFHWRKRIADLGLKIELWPDIYEADLDPIISLKRQHNLCFTVYDDAFINVYGFLVPCGRLQEMGLENVRELGFEAAWNGPNTVKWRQNQVDGNYSKICQLECHMKNTCKKSSKEEAKV